MMDTPARKDPATTPKGRGSVRQRILSAAYELFRFQGTSNVGIEAVVQRASVAKMSLYQHFGSKQNLIAAFLESRQKVWTQEWLQAEVFERATSPADRLLTIFDLYDEWFHSGDFEGCSFVRVLLEYPPDHPSHQTARLHMASFRSFLEELAEEAGIEDKTTFASTWQMMMTGSTVAAYEGNLEAAREAKAVARLFLDSRLPGARSPH